MLILPVTVAFFDNNNGTKNCQIIFVVFMKISYVFIIESFVGIGSCSLN